MADGHKRQRRKNFMGSNNQAAAKPARIERLRDFVVSFSTALEAARGESDIIRDGSRLLAALVDADDWLPAKYAEPDSKSYRQYLLHADSRERFSVVSFVWGPGQKTPIHDHTVWGLVGILRGAENSQIYSRAGDGSLIEDGPPFLLQPGEVTAVSPTIGDFHRVSNAYDDRISISIHVYGANIGAVQRSVYEPDGSRKTFVSGYSNTELPNLWDRSKEQTNN
jgi:predicted metal-dependent enzyme (double-stranded beta helix superfamily)